MKQTKYPIYIISKGRHESRLTAKALEEIGINYRIVIEAQEFDDYASVIDEAKILVLPFSNLGQGSIPARNWVWEHSISEGHARHWILDDNISGFGRLNNNRKIKVKTSATFRAVEDFTDCYTNVKMSGMNYRFFVPEGSTRKPYMMNTRIYSCILLSNDIDHRWRGKYNEDTDLSLRILKDDHCTILFNAFYCDKIGTLKMKGGNTEEVYADSNNRRDFAESLKEQHPDLVKVVWRYERWHHEVNYSVFKQSLKRVDNYDQIVSKGVDNYNMKLLKLKK
jgi:hypothetical protein